ncbi:hypothetical protein FHS15_003985 [Paenibacillus castaneae]|uniref:polysaccharide deacetylase family protein n=1 Tax=Paenibacillus castaneae TaxID=474957 RepID=UPI000C9BAB7A|nr:polysaccharide deacetylase family protein [Paenibacillus castaneae]NIK78839.1 hypothetical protein [Paenibacillus castaneae]
MFEEFGFSSGDRLLIINADDFGLTKATNQAVIHLFEQAAITSTSIMMPCSAAKEAALIGSQRNLSSIGIHLTLTSNEKYSFKPLYQQKVLESLTTADGYFHHNASLVEQNADPEDVRAELDAQIQSAMRLGIDPTHLDNHGGSIMGLHHGRDFLEIAFDLCEKYRLPFLLPLKIVEQPYFSSNQKEIFRKRIDTAKSRGILLIDDLVSLPYQLSDEEGYEDLKNQLIELLKNLKPGITQWTVHPSIVTDELKAVTPHFRERELEYRLLMDPEIKSIIDSENIQLVSWKNIRDLQRKMDKTSGG